jgi:hypothetical protein
MRKLSDRAARGDLKMARVELEPKAADHLRTERWSAVQALEKRYNVHIEINLARNMAPGQAEFTFETNPDATPIKLPAPNFGPAERRDSPEDHEPDEPDELDELDEPDEPDEPDELLTEDAKDESKKNQDADRKPKRSRRRRGRGREDRPLEAKSGSKDEAVRDSEDQAEDHSRGTHEHFDLPTYRFIAPEKLGYTKPGDSGQDEEEVSDDEAGLDGRSRARRRRGRRGGARRGGQPRLAAGREDDGSENATAAAAETPINGAAARESNAAQNTAGTDADSQLEASTIAAALKDDKPKGFGWLKKWLGL